MIQDIAPHIFSNAYAPKRPEATSYALYFDGHMVLASKASATLRFPRFAELNGIEESIYEKAIYLFAIDNDCFYLVHKNKVGDKVFDTDYSLTNTVSWRMNLAESEDGVAVPLPSDKMTLGELTFELYAPNQLGTTPMRRTDKSPVRCNSFHINDVKLKYTTSDYVKDVFNDETYDEDLKFENVIDENIVNDFDDIEFRINTYNEHAGSYSYVLTKLGDRYEFVNTLFNITSSNEQKAEEHCISKYVNYYSKPRFKYSNSIKNKGISLNSILKENTLNKNFVINSITYDLINNKCDVELNEIS